MVETARLGTEELIVSQVYMDFVSRLQLQHLRLHNLARDLLDTG